MKLRIPKSNLTNYISIVLMIIFTALFLSRDIYGVGVNKFIFVLIAAIVFFIEDKNHMYQWIALMIPWVVGLPGSYIMCVAVLIFCFKHYRQIVLHRKGILICLALLLIELFSMVWGNFSVFEYIRFVGVFLVTFIFIFDHNKTYEYDAVVRNFLIGTVIAILNLVGQTLQHYTLSEFLEKGVRFGNTVSSLGAEKEGLQLSFNVNGLGALCCISIFMSLLLARHTKKKIYFGVAVLCVVIGFMTQSRSFLLTVSLGMLLYAVFSVENLPKLFLRLICISIGILLLGMLIAYLMPAYVESLIVRFQVDDLSAGRAGLFWEYWEGQLAIPLSWLLGVGLQNYQQKIGVSEACHMGYQQIVVNWGIVGLILCLSLFVLIISQLKYTKRAQMLYVVPYFVFLFARLSAQIFSLTSYTMYFLVLFACAHLCKETEDTTQSSLGVESYHRDRKIIYKR